MSHVNCFCRWILFKLTKKFYAIPTEQNRLKLSFFVLFFCECFQVPMKEGSSCVIICIHNNICRHLNHVFKCKNLEFLSGSIKFEILLLDYLLQRAFFFFGFILLQALAPISTTLLRLHCNRIVCAFLIILVTWAWTFAQHHLWQWSDIFL